MLTQSAPTIRSGPTGSAVQRMENAMVASTDVLGSVD